MSIRKSLSRAIVPERWLSSGVAVLLLGGLTASDSQAFAQGGVPLWTNLFQAAGYSATATGIALDSRGNVFVTGYSDSDSSRDYLTLGYSNDGVPLWTNRYYDGVVSARAVAVDCEGSVFVTGEGGCDGVSNNSCDWVTIKYSNAGVPLWTNRFDGIANARDWPTALAVDHNGNALVTGFSATSANAINGTGYNFDYVTIKYSGGGQALWTNYYGPAPTWKPAAFIALDRSNNVLVTGNNGPQTIKYSSAGVPLWTNGAFGSITVDNRGDVLVLGGVCFDCGPQCWTITKYSAGGVLLWTTPCNIAYGWARAIAVDRSNSIFVTGVTTNSGDGYTTIKLSEEGVPLWTNRYSGVNGSADLAEPTALVLDSSGNVIVTGSEERFDTNSSSYQFATVAYSSAGVRLWTNLYADQPDSFAFATGLAVDAGGNVFVTGAPYATIKYSSNQPPLAHLDFHTLNRELVLIWTNSGFLLQSAPYITGPFSTIIGATSSYTNSLSGPQQYFRLVEQTYEYSTQSPNRGSNAR